MGRGGVVGRVYKTPRAYRQVKAALISIGLGLIIIIKLDIEFLSDLIKLSS